MKERPIIFSGAMVKAILNGSKTMTRRIVKPQPDPTIYEGGPCHWYAPTKVDPRGEAFPGPEVFGFGDAEADCPCPYGGPGGKLWVREAWAKHPEIEACTCYRADPGHKYDGLKWKPSIHMPRDRCRITLAITEIKVERLNDISAKDIITEGAVERPHYNEHFGKMPVSAFDGRAYTDLKSLWAAGWESIHGKGSWSLNPFVWCIEWPRWTP